MFFLIYPIIWQSMLVMTQEHRFYINPPLTPIPLRGNMVSKIHPPPPPPPRRGTGFWGGGGGGRTEPTSSLCSSSEMWMESSLRGGSFRSACHSRTLSDPAGGWGAWGGRERSGR